jgi:hypothetical protein
MPLLAELGLGFWGTLTIDMALPQELSRPHELVLDMAIVRTQSWRRPAAAPHLISAASLLAIEAALSRDAATTY